MLDAQGNLYVTGQSASANLPSTSGVYQPLPKTGPGDAYVMKFDPAGKLLFSTYLGGSLSDTSAAIALDINGNIYIGGGTFSNDLPVTESAYQKVKKTNEDGWVAKLNPSGTSLIWLTYLGGSSSQFQGIGDAVAGIAVDRNGSAHVTGTTCAIDFPTTAGAVRTPSIGLCDIFVTKFNPNGSTLTYSAVFGGSYPDFGSAIRLDADGNAYVAGSVWSEDVAPTQGVFQRAFAGGLTDVLLAKINPSGTAFVYLTYLGGNDDEYAFDLVLDQTGNVYVSGYTWSDNFPVTSGSYQTNYNGKTDGFVAKVNPTASAIIYAAYVGLSGNEIVHGLAVDAQGNAYLAGSTDSTSFRTTPGAIQTQKAAASDAYLIRLDSEGRTAVYATLLGGNGNEVARRVLLDAQGNAILIGDTTSTNFPVTPDAPQGVWKGDADLFITKIDFVAGIPAAISIVSGNSQSGPVGQALAAPLVAVVNDGRGNPVSGVTVTFAGVNATVSPATAVTDATGRASTRVTLGSTIGPASVSATIAGLPALTFTATAEPSVPPIVISRVVNGGSFNENLAAGAFMTLFGVNLAAVTETASVSPLPETLGGVQVLVNGRAAPLLYVSPAQINAQVPYEVGVGLATAVVVSGSRQSAPSTFVVIPAAPGILMYGAGRAVAQNEDYSLNSPESPTRPGRYITVYLTGLGQLNDPIPTGAPTPPSPLTGPLLTSSATIGGRSATIDFIGMSPGFVGLAQANLLVPDLATGEHAIVITVGTVASNPAWLSVSAPPSPQ